LYKGNDPIVARIARHEGVERYDHGRPADVMLREREAILSTLSEDTLKRFEDLLGRINRTLAKNEMPHNKRLQGTRREALSCFSSIVAARP
jgi:hypothetical protein